MVISTSVNVAGVRNVDARGSVLAVTAVLATVATLLVTPGSGFGPAALALSAWLALLCAASWAALVDDRATGWHRMAAVVVAMVLAGGFIGTAESAWALAFPTVALVGALGRRRSPVRFVAAGAWLVAIVDVLVGAG